MAVFQEAQGFVKEHPGASAAIAVGVVLLIWWSMSGSTPATTTIVQPNTAATAADLAAAQLAADAQTAQTNIAAQTSITQAQIAAGVANNTINAQLAGSVANSNAAVAVANSTNAAAVSQSGNATLSSEFAALASVLNNYATVKNTNSGTADASVALANSSAAKDLSPGQVPYFLQSLVGGSVSTQYSNYANQTVTGYTGNPALGGGSVSTQVAGAQGIISATAGQGTLTGATSTSALSEKGFLTAMDGLTRQLGNGVAFHS
jgi:hypothetical protein